MAETLSVALTPSRIEVEPGGPPVEATVVLENRGDGVEQYTVEVLGLEPQWYDLPVTSVGLFPHDRDQVRVTFHVPAQAGLQDGAYPFAIAVRPSGDAPAQRLEAVLDVRVEAAYQVELEPRHQNGRLRGAFRVQLVNKGTSDVRLALETQDTAGAFHVRLPRGNVVVVPAGGQIDLPLTITPRTGRWVGPERTYQFTVTARPENARGQPQTFSGEYTHRPWLASWEPVRAIGRRAARPALIGLAALMIIVIILAAGVPGRIAAGARATSQAAGQALGGVLAAIPGPWAPKPAPLEARCTIDDRFLGFIEAEAPLIGQCSAEVEEDRFGNGIQLTDKGVLFWLRSSDSVYFFGGDSVYVLVDGRFRLLHGSGRR